MQNRDTLLKTTLDLMQLIRFVLQGEDAATRPSPAVLEAMDLSAVMELAKAHSLAALTAYALQQLGISRAEDDLIVRRAIRRAVLIEQEKEAVLAELSAAGIWHCPLKGSVLKAYYPLNWTREMADVDILFDSTRAEDVRALMEKRGYKAKEFLWGASDDYLKQPLYNFEMHRFLFSGLHKLSKKYFEGIKEKLIASEDDPLRFEFAPEDFYLYMVAHIFAHCENGGAGLRSLVDVAVYLNWQEKKHNEAYLAEEFKKIELEDFSGRLRRISDKLLRGKAAALEPAEKDSLLYFASSGAYGNEENRYTEGVKQGKGKYIWQRVFYSMETVKDFFPFFYKHKILLPLLPFYRLLKGLVKSPRRLLREFKTLLRGKKHKS